MNSTATEAVTGVPTRYQSTTASAEDYIPEITSASSSWRHRALAATAHNWTTCTYRPGERGQHAAERHRECLRHRGPAGPARRAMVRAT